MYSPTLVVKEVSSVDRPEAALPKAAANIRVPTTSIARSTRTAIPTVVQSMGRPSKNRSILPP